MRDKILILEILERLEQTIQDLLESTANILDINKLPESSDGMLRLNGICMCFIIIGEEFNRIDKYTEKQFLPNYPSITWRDIMGMCNRIAHGYFEIDIDILFDTLRNDIPPLLDIVKRMKNDLAV